jgi:hypothetical protein
LISETDIWRGALAMMKRYGDDAMLEAAARADQLLDDGEPVVAATWHRILDAIERLQRRRRPRAKPCTLPNLANATSYAPQLPLYGWRQFDPFHSIGWRPPLFERFACP